MKTKTKRKTKELTFGVGPFTPIKDKRAIALARQIESLDRQIARRESVRMDLKEQLKPIVRFGNSRVGNFRVFKGHVNGHHVKPYFCKAYDTLKVTRSTLRSGNYFIKG